MLEINNLTKVYDDGTVALKDLDFEVEEGEFLVIIGLSGSGCDQEVRASLERYRAELIQLS